MTIRDRILIVSLWLSVITLSIWVGGTLYQMLVIIPMWSASPPESVRAFFLGTDYNRTIYHFFGPPFMVARSLPIVAAVLFGWHLAQQRKWLLVTAVCYAFALIFTLAYIYPINAVLFTQAGGNHSGQEIRAMAERWIWADRLRFAIGIVGFLAVLKAFRLPVPSERKLLT
jgi:hypothetical protein